MTSGRSRPLVTLIAALGRNRVIGADGAMPWHLPADLARFKATTMGHPMVMGRRTWDAIGRALPGRTSVVVTRQPDWSARGALRADSLATALALAAGQPGGAEVFVIGGGQIYAEALPLADTMLLTEVDAEPEGDTYFPAYEPERWRETARERHEGYSFVTYDRRPVG